MLSEQSVHGLVHDTLMRSMATDTHKLASADIKSPLDLIYWASLLLLSHQFQVYQPHNGTTADELLQNLPQRNRRRPLNEAMRNWPIRIFIHTWIKPVHCTFRGPETPTLNKWGKMPTVVLWLGDKVASAHIAKTQENGSLTHMFCTYARNNSPDQQKMKVECIPHWKGKPKNVGMQI